MIVGLAIDGITFEILTNVDLTKADLILGTSKSKVIITI